MELKKSTWQWQCSWLDFFSKLHFGSLKCSGCSASGHSHKRTTLLTATIILSSHTNSVFLHSHKWPAPVEDKFFPSQWCQFMRVSTVITKWLPGNLKINIVCQNKQDTSLGIWQSNPALCRTLQLKPVWQSYKIILRKIAFGRIVYQWRADISCSSSIL